MGNPNSKIINVNKDIQLDEGSVPSTPILTPKVKIIDNDPRSPSANIVRTPINSILDVNKPGTPIVGVINSEENSFINIDPRSPTVEFVRTPIVAENEKQIKLRNKNLDIVRQQLTNFSPMKNTEPKLLSVTPIVKKTDQEKRKSYVGLLETDLDFVETDIDKVMKLNKTLPQVEEVEQIFENTENDKINLNESQQKIKDIEVQKTTEIEVEITKEIVVEKQENKLDVTPIDDHIEIKTKEEIITPIKNTLERISQIDKDIKEIITAYTPTIIIDEVDSNEFDKKLTNLIYEDQEISNIVPMALKIKSENRTPLSDRNGNQQKQNNKTKNKPSRKEYTVSKIPVFKEKKGKKLATQCENTPPRSMDVQPRKVLWDSDKTLII